MPASIINEQIKMELKTQYQQRVDETERELQIVRNKILRIGVYDNIRYAARQAVYVLPAPVARTINARF